MLRTQRCWGSVSLWAQQFDWLWWASFFTQVSSCCLCPAVCMLGWVSWPGRAHLVGVEELLGECLQEEEVRETTWFVWGAKPWDNLLRHYLDWSVDTLQSQTCCVMVQCPCWAQDCIFLSYIHRKMWFRLLLLKRAVTSLFYCRRLFCDLKKKSQNSAWAYIYHILTPAGHREY